MLLELSLFMSRLFFAASRGISLLQCGLKIDGYIPPAFWYIQPMKKFTIPCNFGGTKAPFDVYIGNPKPGNHPLQNQAAWLSAERGGTIPPEVMESFTKLLALAEKHKVSFPDLCAHAMKSVNEDKEKAKGKAAPAATAPAAPNVAEPTAPMDTPGYVPKEKAAYQTPIPEKVTAPSATHTEDAVLDKEKREKTQASIGIGGGGSSAAPQPAAAATTPEEKSKEAPKN